MLLLKMDVNKLLKYYWRKEESILIFLKRFFIFVCVLFVLEVLFFCFVFLPFDIFLMFLKLNENSRMGRFLSVVAFKETNGMMRTF